jgi:hypothetical protein
MANQGGPVSDSATRIIDALGGTELVAEFGELSHAAEDDDAVVRAEESTQGEVSLGEGEDTLQDSSEASESTKASAKPEATQKTSGEKEIITVTDETGKKRKIEIDYSNREQVKRAFAAAAGMRKFQAERDKEIQGRKEIETRLQERERDWNSLEQAFQQGPEHLVDLISGKQGAFRELLEKEIQKRDFLRNASPEEIQALEAREQADMTKKELEKIRKENEEFRNKMSAEREEAETRALESRVHPAFEKYRFAGRLGNATDEHLFDEMLWNSSLKRLEQYETQGLSLSPELVEKEFKAVYSVLSKRINGLAQKKASQVVEQKKREATENVQAQVRGAYSGNSETEKLKKMISAGDTDSIFKNWGSFKGILGNSKK